MAPLWINSFWLKVRPTLSRFAPHLLAPIRKVGLARDEITLRFSVGRNAKPRIFNLDVHVSVIADLSRGLQDRGVNLTRWSISGSNRVFRRMLWIPDPVEVINSSSWRGLDEAMIFGFQKRYGDYLRKFDGFVSTYPPAFSQLYEGFGKPSLTVVATRYEWPYSTYSDEFNAFNNFLARKNGNRDFVIASNNVADRDYLKYFSGVHSPVIPSLCDYTGQRWNGKVSKFLVIAKSPELTAHVMAITNNRWTPARSELGLHYKWKDLAEGAVFFIIPYNISTMTLFELATMGVPVVVPSARLIKELRPQFAGVLSELSFHEMLGGDPSSLEKNDPNNWNSESYLDWWLERADFFDSKLMPNVSVVDSLEELSDVPALLQKYFERNYADLITERNLRLSGSREDLLEDFLGRM